MSSVFSRNHEWRPEGSKILNLKGLREGKENLNTRICDITILKMRYSSIVEMHLVDLYRQFYATEVEYTFFLNTEKTLQDRSHDG